jgi:endonuclease YncB( thermonuclease family)
MKASLLKNILVLFLSTLMITSCHNLKLITRKDNNLPDKSSTLEVKNPYLLCVPNTYPPETGIVVKVIDGDSIRVSIEGKVYEVRYIGMNAPEYGDNEEDAARIATEENKKMVEGKTIQMYRDVSNTDKYGRLLRYIFFDGIFVNKELVSGGYAEVRAYPPDVSCHHIIGGN